MFHFVHIIWLWKFSIQYNWMVDNLLERMNDTLTFKFTLPFDVYCAPIMLCCCYWCECVEIVWEPKIPGTTCMWYSRRLMYVYIEPYKYVSVTRVSLSHITRFHWHCSMENSPPITNSLFPFYRFLAFFSHSNSFSLSLSQFHTHNIFFLLLINLSVCVSSYASIDIHNVQWIADEFFLKCQSKRHLDCM